MKRDKCSINGLSLCFSVSCSIISSPQCDPRSPTRLNGKGIDSVENRASSFPSQLLGYINIPCVSPVGAHRRFANWAPTCCKWPAASHLSSQGSIWESFSLLLHSLLLNRLYPVCICVCCYLLFKLCHWTSLSCYLPWFNVHWPHTTINHLRMLHLPADGTYWKNEYSIFPRPCIVAHRAVCYSGLNRQSPFKFQLTNNLLWTSVEEHFICWTQHLLNFTLILFFYNSN